MQITESFTVPTTAEEVWSFFKDVRAVTECMPGTELTEEIDESAFRGNLAVKVGPVSSLFNGEARVERNDALRSGTINAEGVDRRGGSRARAVVSFTVTEDGSYAKVDIVADVKLAGQLAQFGRTGLIQHVSASLTKEFAGHLQERLAEPHPRSQTDPPC
jgi:carbon monoxide dehydrogenase subunit G